MFTLILFNAAMAAMPAGAINNGDGSYSYPPSAGLMIGDREVHGAVTWEYVGQIRYAMDGETLQPHQLDLPGRWKDIGVLGQVLGASWHRTSDHSLWQAVDADVPTIQMGLSMPDDVHEEDGGIPNAHDWMWLEPESYWYTPTSWSRDSCPAGGGSKAKFQVWDGESIFRNAALDTWEQSVVWLSASSPGGDAGLCSGVLVGTDDDDTMQGWVLTAAHCLFDSDHNLFEDLTVCTYGNGYPGAECDDTLSPNDEVDVFISPRYQDWTWNPGDDIALVRATLDSSTYRALKLSEASDAFVTRFDMTEGSHHVLHFDSHTHVCGSTDPTESLTDGICFCQDNTVPAISALMAVGSRLQTQHFNITAPVTTDTFHAKADGGNGYSGSPIWYCGSSPCSLTSYTPRAGVVSVVSGRNGAYNRQVGPKVRNFRAWAFGIMAP
ncbi:MAG: trypsin-like serine protease [Myxococcota bacterium]